MQSFVYTCLTCHVEDTLLERKILDHLHPSLLFSFLNQLIYNYYNGSVGGVSAFLCHVMNNSASALC